MAASDFAGTDSSEYNYYFRLCGAQTSSAACTAIEAGVSACQTEIPNPNQAWAQGVWQSQSVDWNYIDPSQPSLGVTYSMIGTRTTTMEFHPDVKCVCT
jgi:hypothetical protein